MQEEGWVVCRAFKKPCPSHQRPGFEYSWSGQAQCFRDQISHGRSLLSYTNTLNTNQPLSHVLYPSDEGTSLSHPFTSDHHHQHQLVPNDTVLDPQQQHQLVELIPQLDSPTARMAVKENGLINEDNYSEEIRNNDNINGQCIDWKSFDNLFASHFTHDHDTVPYFSHPNMPLLPHTHDLQLQVQPQNHQVQATHVLGCFPDS